MIGEFLRKTSQFLNDPVLRKWLIGRALGQWPGAPIYAPHRPPYLEALPDIVLKEPKPPQGFDTPSHSKSDASFSIQLPGKAVEVQPGEETALLQTSYEDIEAHLALHRFAWVPTMGDAASPAWVDALWRTWCQYFEHPDDSWAWHPYTTAERVINILDFAQRHGLPGEQQKTLNILAQHGPAIATRLEYFGEQNTSNHLSNNGRGLYRLGLALGLSDCIGRGADILLKEAERIFLPSGVLREGSSHYHLLLTRNYADAWLAAREHKRAEERPLREIVKRALAVIPHLSLPGRFPLIGDISPDCPPSFLAGFYGQNTGWLKQLPEDSQQALNELIKNTVPVSKKALTADGWCRFDYKSWAGLWFVAPTGWAPMPGHGHHDIGGFELHYKNDPLFIDLGRGAYGETGEADHYRSGQAHNTVLINHQDPYPPNKPYYNDAFRKKICGDPPNIQVTDNKIDVTHAGYARLRGVKTIERSWRFKDNEFDLIDNIQGSKQSLITRRLHTQLPVEKTESGVVIQGQAARYIVEADVPVETESVVAWQEYGSGESATALIFGRREKLPCKLKLTIRVQERAI